MNENGQGGPVINFDAEPTQEETATMLKQLQGAPQPSSAPPLEALNLLYELACQLSGGSQAARYFLFWLDGLDDPTGYKGDGGIELRRLDAKHKRAALAVLAWWAGPTESDDPLLQVLARLLSRFAGKKTAEWQPNIL